MFFFFKQKTAYEMRISDWSSDVCSSDLCLPEADIRIIDKMPIADLDELVDVQYLVLIRERSRITAKMLDQLPALKAIVQTCTAGMPETSHIDLGACAARNIPIIEGGAIDGHSAAEITWALILNAKIGRAHV